MRSAAGVHVPNKPTTHLFFADLATSDIASSSAPVCFTPHLPAMMAPTSLADPCNTLHRSMYCARGGSIGATTDRERISNETKAC